MPPRFQRYRWNWIVPGVTSFGTVSRRSRFLGWRESKPDIHFGAIGRSVFPSPRHFRSNVRWNRDSRWNTPLRLTRLSCRSPLFFARVEAKPDSKITGRSERSLSSGLSRYETTGLSMKFKKNCFQTARPWELFRGPRLYLKRCWILSSTRGAGG